MNTNQVVLTGSISKVELKEYHGRAVANASLLFANGKGTAQLNISAWGQLAEQLANLTDGTAVTVKGRMAASFFTTREGRKAQKLYLLVWTIEDYAAEIA